MQRSQMLRSGASRGVARPVLARASAPASPMAHLLDAGVLPQQQMMQAGKLSSHALTSQYLGRIRSLCSIGARTYPGIEINPDALKIALEMDRERQVHKVRGPLHGIPVVLRDNIATGDRMKTRTQAPWPRRPAAIPLWRRACARPAPSSSAKAICASGLPSACRMPLPTGPG